MVPTKYSPVWQSILLQPTYQMDCFSYLKIFQLQSFLDNMDGYFSKLGHSWFIL